MVGFGLGGSGTAGAAGFREMLSGPPQSVFTSLSLPQSSAQHITNLCHYSVIASNHMISFRGSGGGLLGASGRGGLGVMVRWHCDGGVYAVLYRAKDAPSFSLAKMASG
uniref:Uncharacterized protein n=1 Tax=Knipowitschia caucasica TaxID=637954 RepID=A0AAV2JZZ3_KNICA